MAWSPVAQTGTLYSYTVIYRPPTAAFKQDVPYNVALIQLEEGPRMYSNIVGTPNDQVRIGDAVQAVFDPVTDEVTIPRFRIAAPT